MSAASHARDAGWKVGTVLYGSPIILDGKQIECGRTLIITAIGQEQVLGIAQLDGEDRWWPEMAWGFDSRTWTVEHDHDEGGCTCGCPVADCGAVWRIQGSGGYLVRLFLVVVCTLTGAALVRKYALLGLATYWRVTGR